MNAHYAGSPWHADESDDVVRFHREHMQVFKAAKHSTQFAAYWPGPRTIQWLLEALTRARMDESAVAFGE